MPATESARQPDRTDQSRVELVPIASLVTGLSPRSETKNFEHVRMLANTDAALPPIIVHRPTMRVIDGAHRLQAAVLRGRDTIEVRFFEGSESQAFVLAVQTNIAHGLPLSLADRESAAARIISDFPSWSDRAIASATGLAAATVGAIRRRTGAGDAGADSRVGRDGRVRPLNSQEGRRTASAVIRERPEASLREIAQEAGISPATARDVRARMRRGEDPVPERLRTAGGDKAGRRPEPAGQDPLPADLVPILHGLRNDPVLRFTESGRALLRWLYPRAMGVQDWDSMTPLVPSHCSYTVARLARRCSQEWLHFADRLEQQAGGMA